MKTTSFLGAVLLCVGIATLNINSVDAQSASQVNSTPHNGLSLTPPMGWNSWNRFSTHIDDAIVRKIADAMVSSGMRDAGYVYLNIDDSWEGQRDSTGQVQPNAKFPDMKALIDYVHGKGLKFGIYSSPGPTTCANYLGSHLHEESDAKVWASWGVDYLKYDWCSAANIYSNSDLPAVYQKMALALLHSGRPIVFSLCEYGLGSVQTWGARIGANLWRTTNDIRDNWDSMSNIGFSQNALAPFAGPGHWNDPDMLEIGNGGMNQDEYRTHMSLWSLLSAPLLAGNDITQMSMETKEILLNSEVIAIDQDILGKQATRYRQSAETEIWIKALADGGMAVGLFNRATSETTISFTQNELKLTGNWSAKDLWTHKEVDFSHATYTATVGAHSVVLLRLNRLKPDLVAQWNPRLDGY